MRWVLSQSTGRMECRSCASSGGEESGMEEDEVRACR